MELTRRQTNGDEFDKMRFQRSSPKPVRQKPGDLYFLKKYSNPAQNEMNAVQMIMFCHDETRSRQTPNRTQPNRTEPNPTQPKKSERAKNHKNCIANPKALARTNQAATPDGALSITPPLFLAPPVLFPLFALELLELLALAAPKPGVGVPAH